MVSPLFEMEFVASVALRGHLVESGARVSETAFRRVSRGQ
jgi:hypothetical protein